MKTLNEETLQLLEKLSRSGCSIRLCADVAKVEPEVVAAGLKRRAQELKEFIGSGDHFEIVYDLLKARSMDRAELQLSAAGYDVDLSELFIETSFWAEDPEVGRIADSLAKMELKIVRHMKEMVDEAIVQNADKAASKQGRLVCPF